MTQPTPPSPLASARARLAALAGRLGATRLSALSWAAIVVGVVLLVAGVVWANGMTAPVHRQGRPTTSVTPLPAPTTATPTPTPTPSGSGSPSPTASSTPTSAPSADWPRVTSSGKFETAGVSVPAAGSAGTVHRYSVRVETSAKLDADKVGRQVAAVLNDPRSWAGSGSVRFALVPDPGKADFTITVAAPGTAGKICRIDGGGSCVEAGDVVIDASWWRGLPPTYQSRGGWQSYLVNHGVGRLLGEKAADCTKKGKPAPVTMAQSADLGGCVSNPWPFP